MVQVEKAKMKSDRDAQDKGQADAGGGDLARLMAQVDPRQRPPVDQWKPDFCGDMDLRIARDGTWFYMGSPIGRAALVRLFASILRRDGDDYFLVTPVEKVRIRVDDAPFVAVELEARGAGDEQELLFRTNVDDVVIAGPGHPIRVETELESGAPAPYILVRDRLEALINRPVFYQLVDLGVDHVTDGRAALGVWSGGRFFSLGETGEPALA